MNKQPFCERDSPRYTMDFALRKNQNGLKTVVLNTSAVKFGVEPRVGPCRNPKSVLCLRTYDCVNPEVYAVSVEYIKRFTILHNATYGGITAFI